VVLKMTKISYEAQIKSMNLNNFFVSEDESSFEEE
tara:strand:- start:287 stop:391 length:105 start_codon:yes stop_codon:yes gene_type:complete